MYDVANKSSFTALKNWLEEIKKFGKRKPAIIVVAANKVR